MTFSEYSLEVKNLFYVIDKIEFEAINELSSLEKLSDHEERLSQEQIDYSSIYERLKNILIPSINYYSYFHDEQKRKMAEKVFFVAICEMIKQDYSRGMLITLRSVTGQVEINTNRYYDLLQRVSDSQELVIEKANGRRLFEKTYILQTGIPKNLTKYVTRMFKIYWRYFREMAVQDRRDEIHRYLYGEELSEVYIVDPKDANVFEDYRNYLKDFPEKSIRVFDRLDDIFVALDECSELISIDSRVELVETINEKVGFDISTVLRDSELVDIYYSYLQQIPISKFLKIINNLPKNEIVILPEGQSKRVESISEKKLCCGVYKIRGNRYDVVIDPVISLDDILAMPCNQIIQLSKDYYCYVSRNYFEVEYDGRDIRPRRFIYKGQERQVWFGKLAPASMAYVDGNRLLSSEICKRSIVVKKYFDYDIRESRLQIKINSIKVSSPQYKFKKLTFSVNEREPELLAVGDVNGKFYRDGIHIEVDETREYAINYFVNEDCIFYENVILKKNYLFDKWIGTEYLSNSTNGSHSGEFIYFSEEELNTDEVKYDISNSYVANGYFIYEFIAQTKETKIDIAGNNYLFDKAGKPALYICTDDGQQQYFDYPEKIEFQVINLSEENQYFICIENDNGVYKYVAEQKAYRLEDLLEEFKSGKWNISLWEKQKKYDEVSFTIIPKLIAHQRNISMEGSDVEIEIFASEECFVSSVGGNCNNIFSSIGQAELIMENGNISSAEIEHYVYLDKYELCKKITFRPQVWSVRIKEADCETWERKQQFAINPIKAHDIKMAVLTNASFNIYVNGKAKDLEPGINDIDIINTIGSLRKRNEIVFTDDNYSWKEIITCNTIYKYKDITLNDDAVITFQYNGPISENLVIRYFIDGIHEKNIYKEIFKNNFLIHVFLGKTMELNGKHVSVDVRNESVNVPTSIYDEFISISESLLSVKKTTDNESLGGLELEPLNKYVLVEKLGEVFFKRKEKKIDLSFEKIRDMIGGWIE